MDYQLEGAEFLATHRQAFLADEPGIGKTCQAIRACDMVGAVNILVLVPASVRVNWLLEFEKFSPFDRPGVAILDGKTKPAPIGVTVCSYDILQNLKLRKSLLARQWDVIILDEAHRLKTRSAQVTKSVYGRKADGLTGLVSCARNCWRLSGTPAPNHVDELWTHLHSAGLFPANYVDFVTKFCTGYSSDYGFRITGTKNAVLLKELLQPFLLRRKKLDVLPKLPPIEFEHHLIEPSVVDEELFFAEVRMSGNAGLHAELKAQNGRLSAAQAGDNTTEYLRSMATSAGTLRRYLGLAKVPGYLAVIRPELKARRYDKLVIGAWHKDVIEWLHRDLKDFGAITLYGGTPADKRQTRLDRFKSNKACRVLICQVKVAIGFAPAGAVESVTEEAQRLKSEAVETTTV